MMNVGNPWRSEVELDNEGVLAVLREQFPTLSASSVRYLHEGWDSRAFVVDNSLIFRFPKRRTVHDRLSSELAILNALAPLDLSPQIPRPEWIGHPGTHFPFTFMGYRMIAGTPGDTFSPEQVDRPAISAALGGFLSAIHGPGSLSVAGLSLPSRTDETSSPGSMLENLRGVAEDAVTALSPDLLRHAIPYLDGTIALPSPGLNVCLVHDDLQAEHVFIDTNGRISGIIDWGDAGLGDPTADFAGLYVWLGADAARNALDCYTVQTDSFFWDRVVFRARCLSLIGVGWAVRGGDVGLQAKCLALAQRTFSVGEDFSESGCLRLGP